MIRYDLTCEKDHGFEAWFRDSSTYDAQAAEGRVACAVCGSTQVRKALMAPAVRTRGDDPPRPTLSAPPSHPAAAALAALRKHVEETADYVGPRFAEEARRIHLGESEERAIWGEATGAEAKALVEDGVPVAPLPFMSRRDD